MKRHYESIHARDLSEDHMAHLIWGFMAIIHVVAVFPQLNNLQETPHCQHSELQQHREHSKSPCNRSSTTCDTQTAVALWRACTLHTLRGDSDRGALARLHPPYPPLRLEPRRFGAFVCISRHRLLCISRQRMRVRRSKFDVR